MEALHRAVNKKQGHELARLAHRLKGSVGNFAARPASQAASELEKIANQGEFGQIAPVVDVLDHEIERLQAALEEWANKPPLNETEAPLAPPPPPAASADAGMHGP
jgi:HPt (histidine-containing phosphotransfer) domain-containing protein